MIAGILSGIVLMIIPGQSKRSKRLSRIMGLLAGLYPLGIFGLYMGRSHLGESYAYLIFGSILAILLGLVAGIFLVLWLIFYVNGLRR